MFQGSAPARPPADQAGDAVNEGDPERDAEERQEEVAEGHAAMAPVAMKNVRRALRRSVSSACVSDPPAQAAMI